MQSSLFAALNCFAALAMTAWNAYCDAQTESPADKE